MSELKIFLLAMLPIAELRAAIPIAITVYQLTPLSAYIIAVLGNMFACLVILLFLSFFSKWSYHKIYFLNRFFAWLFSKTRNKHLESVEKYGVYLLPIFVAIPLPMTGAWTASLIAFVFGINLVKAFFLISIGIMMSGIIVLFLTLGGIFISQYFGLQLLVGIIVISLVIYFLIKKNRFENRY